MLSIGYVHKTAAVCCGPCCCADEGANPAHIAADLLSQAEHGPDSQVVLLALPGVDLDAVQLAVQKQCDELPRNETARKALSHSCVVQVSEGRCSEPREGTAALSLHPCVLNHCHRTSSMVSATRTHHQVTISV